MREQRVPIDSDREMSVVLGGEGDTTLIFDAGWGQWSPVWRPVLERIEPRYPVLAFDRMGLGGSDVGEGSRTAFQIVDELQAAMAALSLDGRFVYVGHSFGAVHARVLAHRDPRVVGMVLINPIVEAIGVSPPFRALRDQLNQRFEKLRRRAGLLAPVSLLGVRPSFVRKLPKEARKRYRQGLSAQSASTTIGEIASSDASLQELAGLGAPKVPFRILSAAEDWLPDPPGGDGETRAQAMQRKLAESVSHGHFLVVDETSHDLHIDRPDLVVEAVDALVADF